MSISAVSGAAFQPQALAPVRSDAAEGRVEGNQPDGDGDADDRVQQTVAPSVAGAGAGPGSLIDVTV